MRGRSPRTCPFKDPPHTPPPIRRVLTSWDTFFMRPGRTDWELQEGLAQCSRLLPRERAKDWGSERVKPPKHHLYQLHHLRSARVVPELLIQMVP